MSEGHDVVADRQLHADGAGEHERRVEQRRAGRPSAEQLVAGLRLGDLAEIEDEGPARADAVAERLAVGLRRGVEADAEDDARDVRVSEAPVHELALLRREKAEGAWQREEPPVGREAERQLIVRRRDEHAPFRDQRQTERRRLVDVRPEQDGVV
jgi:hypothetical protein